MDCRQAEKRLAAFQDGELEAGIRGEVAEHLGACLGCRRRLRAFERVAEVLGALPEFAEPTDAAFVRARRGRLVPAATLLGLLLALFTCIPSLDLRHVEPPSPAVAGPRTQWRGQVQGHGMSLVTQGGVEVIEVSFSRPGGLGFDVSYRQVGVGKPWESGGNVGTPANFLEEPVTAPRSPSEK